ncbi:MAG: hypothetical protein Q4C54_01115 [Clostridia bacterium]|nr:hypothetical protein [Clostridia bacterium]
MQSRNRSYYTDRSSAQKRKAQRIRIWVLTGIVLVVLGIIFLMLQNVGSSTEMTAIRLTCLSSQAVTPFGNNVLYYDGVSIHCLSSNGAIRWSYTVGSDASFACSDTHIAIWIGNQLYFVDQNGHPTYNEALSGNIQFARVGKQYVAVVLGSDTSPELSVKDLQGSQIDEETEAFKNTFMLDMGFFGDNGENLWTLAMDIYGTTMNTMLNTFQVGKMNTGVVSLGEKPAYSILFENKRLRVFTTQQLLTFDYKAVQDTNDTRLVYGWEHIGTFIPERGDAAMLLAPTTQTGSNKSLSDLRVIQGNNDRRYTLPGPCVGADVVNNSIYGFSSRYIFRSDIATQRFYPYAIPLPEGENVTAYLGMTKDNHALLACGETVYSVNLPE